MRAFATTSIRVLLCGSSSPNDTFSALLTRCNVFLKFKGDHSHLIMATTIHERIKKTINSVPSIKADMLTYQKLIASDNLDTSAMVKKADALVRTHSNRMHTAYSSCHTFSIMLLPHELTAAIQRTGTSKYFTGSTPVKPKDPMSPPIKSALKGVQIQRKERLVAHVAAKYSGPKTASPVTNVASASSSSKTQYPQKDLSKIKCFKCDQICHFAYDCPNPS
jgi:hypothetical protein